MKYHNLNPLSQISDQDTLFKSIVYILKETKHLIGINMLIDYTLSGKLKRILKGAHTFSKVAKH